MLNKKKSMHVMQRFLKNDLMVLSYKEKVLKERVNKGTQCQLNDPTGPL